MGSLNVFELTGKRALVTRASAAEIGSALNEASTDGEIIVDFAGVDAVTPSFVDEILAVVEELVRDRDAGGVSFLHIPTRLSEKFVAVGRAHQLSVTESEDGTWAITPSSAVA